eukprot:gnl/TRDRNA2_/TRDRNA2_177260_c1_seq2.p1 gnl/TRDRNA2_/TRDRNA2_177260_c1~~gnl/TRDRNA2_/TRDRNA2_177260_c1_seq2.p1  ORF type:complete len:389 (+),score=137.90 gnl/TRDRNA2_/TRDRNA2_177260_c1_seq2:64-1167(+)
MAAIMRSLIVLCLVFCASAALLRVPNSTKGAAPLDDKAKVAALRAKLQKMSVGLVASMKGGALDSKLETAMQAFVDQLDSVLKETAGEKNFAKALKELQNAQAGVQSLVKDMTMQQMRLMKEGDDQEYSLLLGVLMTKQKEPMAKQLEIVMSPEFSHLPVVAALKAAKDNKTPLFKQVAAYLDKHPSKPVPKPESDIPETLSKGKDGKPDVRPIVAALEVRLHHLEENEKRVESVHKDEVHLFDQAAKKAEKKGKAMIQRINSMRKKENRKYSKEVAVAKDDIKSLKTAIEAIKQGNMKALMKSKAALQASLKSMQAHSGGFLYLIQMSHRMEGRDCPYCAAQCVDKCHTAGKPYVQCLTDCADAGK